MDTLLVRERAGVSTSGHAVSAVGHLVNVLLYGVCCGLLFLILVRILPRRDAFLPLLTTLLFVAHPIHTEVVANIKSRDEILALLASLASLGLCIRAIDTKRTGPMAAAGIFFFLALMKIRT